jgi:fatty acid desaturase
VAADFTYVSYPHPHVERGRRILAAHPELRTLATPFPVTALWVAALVAAQLVLAVAVGGRPWYVWLPVAYIVGATIDHALWVLIHDSCHNLVFGWRTGNRLVALLANLPFVFPSAMSFWKYHLLHHGHLNELERRFVDHRSGRRDHGYALWSAWVLERWLEGTRGQDGRSSSVTETAGRGGLKGDTPYEKAVS